MRTIDHRSKQNHTQQRWDKIIRPGKKVKENRETWNRDTHRRSHYITLSDSRHEDSVRGSLFHPMNAETTAKSQLVPRACQTLSANAIHTVGHGQLLITPRRRMTGIEANGLSKTAL